MSELIAIVIVAGCAYLVGLSVGTLDGKEKLCKEQFAGEMHGDKCVKVIREEVK